MPVHTARRRPGAARRPRFEEVAADSLIATAPRAREREFEFITDRADDGASARGILLGALLGGLLWTGLVLAGLSIQASWFR